MPLTSKGSEILHHMEQEYGEKKGKSVFYASKNAERISGVDSMNDTISAKLDMLADGCDRLDARLDAMTRRDAGDEPGNGKEPYGDVKYADPGYQSDKKERYPIDTEKHIRAAWNYIHKHRDEDKYTPEQTREIEGRIKAAWKKEIGGEPPEAEGK